MIDFKIAWLMFLEKHDLVYKYNFYMEKTMHWITYNSPKKFVYFFAIRMLADLTMKGTKSPSEYSYMDALELYRKKHNL